MNGRISVVGGLFGILALLVIIDIGEVRSAETKQLARRSLDASGIEGGVVVQVGCGDGQLTAALGASDRFLVHALDTDEGNVEATRKQVKAGGLYGRVSVEPWSGTGLPYIDNFVNLIVVSSSISVDENEINRVLCPGGVALKLGADEELRSADKIVKPRPAEMDQWTHYLYDSTGNAVAHDSLVEPPTRYQWVGGQRYSRQHDHMSRANAVVSADGRVFCIFDEAPRA